MGQPPITIPLDENGNPIHKFLDQFEYVRGNTTANPVYYGYLHADGVFAITEISDPGTPTEHVKFLLSRGGSSVLNTLWGDGTTLGELTFVEYDELY